MCSTTVTDSASSFDSIDPTPSHASAHPQKRDSDVVFSIHDSTSETPNTVPVIEITTRHIRRLASSATDFLGRKVNAAVITVPTDFSEGQQEALSKASKAAGIEVLQFISEPTAAILAYDARPEAKLSDKTVIVADLGGTRSDIAVVASRGGMYSILSTAHDYETGGAQLDQVLIDHFAKEFIKKNKKDPRENQRSLAKLKLEAEATKKALSIGANASFSAESLVDGIDFTSTINRLRYETLANKVFGSFSRLIEEAVRKAGLDILDIDEVLGSYNVLGTCEPNQCRRSSCPVGPLTPPKSLESSPPFSRPLPASSPLLPLLRLSTLLPLQPAALPYRHLSFKNSRKKISNNLRIQWLLSHLIFVTPSVSLSSARTLKRAPSSVY